MGGSDEPSNLVELSVEEHTNAHKELWEKYGHWQDKIAWRGLANMIDKIEIISKAQSSALKDYHNKPETKEKYAKLNQDRWNDENHRKYVSDSTKKQWLDESFRLMHKNKMVEHNKKIWSNQEYKNKIIESNRNNNRKVISKNDGKITTWSNKKKHENKTGFQHIWMDLE